MDSFDNENTSTDTSPFSEEHKVDCVTIGEADTTSSNDFNKSQLLGNTSENISKGPLSDSGTADQGDGEYATPVDSNIDNVAKFELNEEADASDDDDGANIASNGISRTKAPFVSSWLDANYEPFEGVSLPRSTLYNHYLEQCELASVDPVNAASFGKIIRSVFPNLKTRRLGTRGNSKYHYYGIKLKSDTVPAGTEYLLTTKNTDIKPSTFRRSRKRNVEPQPDILEVNEQNFHEKMFSDSSSDEFICMLQEHCHPVPSNIAPHISLETLQEFCGSYRSHCQKIVSLIATRDFFSIEACLKQFWQSLSSEIIPNLNCEEACRVVGVTDDLLHQAITQMLMINVLEPIPISLTQSIRHYAKNLENWLLASLDGIPMAIVDVKLDSAKRFTQVLRRRTSLNHLAQAARTVLQNPDQVNQMLNDWSQVDFEGVKEQASWIIACRENVIESVENSFRTYLKQGVSLEFWAEWLEGIVDQCLAAETSENEHIAVVEAAARQFLLKWSFFSTLVMRDLTLRSASSFGSFHLIRLLYDEYIFYIIERKLEDLRRRCIEEHWANEASLMNHANEGFMHPGFTAEMARQGMTAPLGLPGDFGVPGAVGHPGEPGYGSIYYPADAMTTGPVPGTFTAATERSAEGNPTQEQGNYAAPSKKKIRVDSSLATILNC